MEALEPIVVARIPSVVTSVVPVCVVSSVSKCVLKRAHSVEEIASVSEKVCADETPCIKETPCAKETPCVSGVVASVPKCVLPSTPCIKETPCVEEAPRVEETACVSNMVCVSETPCVSGTTCANEMVRVSEARCVRGTACVRSLYVREMTVGMREHATACPRVNVMVRCVSVVACGSLSARVRQRRRHWKDKGRVAAVAVLGTAPGLHGSERGVWAVLCMRPPRARLRE